MTEKEQQQIDRDVLAALKALAGWSDANVISKWSGRKVLHTYHSLDRLEKAGMVDTRLEQNPDGFKSWYYRLAPAGRTDKD